MDVVVFGATGPTGVLLCEQALAAGHSVRAVSRNSGPRPISDSALTPIRADAVSGEGVREAVLGTDAVLSVLGAPYSRHTINVYSAGTAHMVEAIRAGGRGTRLVVVSSGLTYPAPGHFGWVAEHLVFPILRNGPGRTLYADMRRMEEYLHTCGDIAWTVMSPGSLTKDTAVSRTGSMTISRLVATPPAATWPPRCSPSWDLTGISTALSPRPRGNRRRPMPTKTRLLAKRRALVTGESRGVGSANSLALTQLGCDISISYRHGAQAAAAVVSGCRAVGIAPLAFSRVRLSDRDRNDLASKAAADSAELHRLRLAVVPGMKHGFGKVSVISSGVAWEPEATGLTAHGVSKAAMDAHTRCATFEPASGVVAINSLQLGMVETAGNSVVPAPACSVLAAATPAGHIATPEEIVGVIALLAQPGSGWINGTTVLVTDGMNYPMNLVAVLSSTEHDPDEAS